MWLSSTEVIYPDLGHSPEEPSTLSRTNYQPQSNSPSGKVLPLRQEKEKECSARYTTIYHF